MLVLNMPFASIVDPGGAPLPMFHDVASPPGGTGLYIARLRLSAPLPPTFSGNVNDGGRFRIGGVGTAVTVHVNIALTTPAGATLLLARSFTLYVFTAAVSVPVIAPVLALITNPAGSKKPATSSVYVIGGDPVALTVRVGDDPATLD